jgi:hypothetical protein
MNDQIRLSKSQSARFRESALHQFPRQQHAEEIDEADNCLASGEPRTSDAMLAV